MLIKTINKCNTKINVQTQIWPKRQPGYINKKTMYMQKLRRNHASPITPQAFFLSVVDASFPLPEGIKRKGEYKNTQ